VPPFWSLVGSRAVAQRRGGVPQPVSASCRAATLISYRGGCSPRTSAPRWPSVSAFPKSSLVRRADPDGPFVVACGLRSKASLRSCRCSSSPAPSHCAWSFPNVSMRTSTDGTGGASCRLSLGPDPPAHRFRTSRASWQTCVADRARPGLGHRGRVQDGLRRRLLRVIYTMMAVGRGVDPRDPGRLRARGDRSTPQCTSIPDSALVVFGARDTLSASLRDLLLFQEQRHPAGTISTSTRSRTLAVLGVVLSDRVRGHAQAPATSEGTT